MASFNIFSGSGINFRSLLGLDVGETPYFLLIGALQEAISRSDN